jgi:serine/threonine protein kinase
VSLDGSDITGHSGDVVLGRYRLEAVLDNTRSWAELWVGEDTALKRAVAVRVLDPTDPRTPVVLDAARAAAALDDARCVRVLDVTSPADSGISADSACIVRAWVDGTTLGDLLVEAPLDPAEAADLVADIAEAIAVAHEAGLRHGLLDPQHVVLTPGGDVAVLDLGIAEALHAPLPGADADPENSAASRSPVEALDDVRALGGLLYACLTGRWPGRTPSVLDPATTISGPQGSVLPLPPRRARAGVPGALDVLCRRALGERVGQEEPFDDARSVAVALRRWLGRAGASTSDLAERRAATGAGEPRSSAANAGSTLARWIVALIVVVLVAGVAFIGVQVLDDAFGEPEGSPPPGPVSTTTP